MFGVVLSRFFFASRRRHTRCALVTGVRTCALPICRAVGDAANLLHRRAGALVIGLLGQKVKEVRGITDSTTLLFRAFARSEARSVGKECVRTCRSRWWPHH